MKMRIVSESIRESSMRIDIKDFAKIEEASIKVDGITVIAGAEFLS